jgi:16S rRNA (cytidine1402-2'-O)-methyltransferase
MGTLYVASAPVGDLDDITLRALRKLREVSLVAATNPPRAGELLAQHDISTPLADAANADALLATLEAEDVLLLADEELSYPLTGTIVRLALEQGRRVIPIPGPALPITALVASGLPADGFVYLGELSPQSGLRRDLFTSLARERRTLVAMATADHLPGHLADALDTLGDRPLVVVAGSDPGPESVWRGTVGGAAAVSSSTDLPWKGRCVLVIGGAKKRAERWDEEVLRTEVRMRMEQGLSVKEVSQMLASESGWSGREVYRMAVEEI